MGRPTLLVTLLLRVALTGCVSSDGVDPLSGIHQGDYEPLRPTAYDIHWEGLYTRSIVKT